MRSAGSTLSLLRHKVAPGTAHIDHFIPWSRYPIDLGHNFVLAHAGCNSAKAYHTRRKRTSRPLGGAEPNGCCVPPRTIRSRLDRPQCAKIGAYRALAYSQAAATRVLAWVKGREFQPIDESCVLLLS